MNQKDREFYIEYRMYLEPDARVGEVNAIAAELHDKITDIVSDEYVPGIFTQDVTYRVEIPLRKETN